MTPDEHSEFDDACAVADLAAQMAEAVYTARIRIGLTTSELADRMGTSALVIEEIEAGGATPTLDLLDRLARACEGKLVFRIDAA